MGVGRCGKYLCNFNYDSAIWSGCGHYKCHCTNLSQTTFSCDCGYTFKVTWHSTGGCGHYTCKGHTQCSTCKK